MDYCMSVTYSPHHQREFFDDVSLYSGVISPPNTNQRDSIIRS